MAEEPKARKPQDTDAPSTSLYQCDICGETFDTRQELLYHERTHMGEQVGRTGTSDRAAAEGAGMPTGKDDKELPFGGERRKWTTGDGDREEGEMTGRETPGGRNAGLSGDAGPDRE